MNKDVVRKWIKALRSGDYKQVRYTHRQGEDRHCVIGVLCDLHAKEFDREKFWFPLGEDYSYGIGVIPDSITDWLGEDSQSVLRLNHVVIRNDDRCETFDQLAQYIEDKMKEHDPSFVA